MIKKTSVLLIGVVLSGATLASQNLFLNKKSNVDFFQQVKQLIAQTKPYNVNATKHTSDISESLAFSITNPKAFRFISDEIRYEQREKTNNWLRQMIVNQQSIISALKKQNSQKSRKKQGECHE